MTMMNSPGRNDPCLCKSGKKYKHCCMGLVEGRGKLRGIVRDSHSLIDKNQALLIAASDIFRLDLPWEKVKSGMSDARIKEFYQFIAGLWPPDTDYKRLLPKPDSTLRALYLGENDPEMMLQNVFRFSLYADQIILVNPFDNPHCIADKFNPILHPEEWRIQTLRLVYHLRILVPWIAAGLVLLVPSPGDFDYQLRRKTFELALKRLPSVRITDEDLEGSSTQNRMRETFFMAPEEYLERIARETNPGMSDEEVSDVLDYIRLKRETNPLLLNETLDNIPGQMSVHNMGTNLETGLLMCQMMGAFPYTNVRFRWREILSAGNELSPTSQVWSPLTNAFGQLDFKFLSDVDSKFAVTMRQEGRLEGFRGFMRKIWKTVDGVADESKSEALARDFRDELAGEYDKAKAEWSAIDRDLIKWAIPALLGGISSAGSMATGHYGLAVPGAGFAVKGINELVQAHMKRKEFRQKTPLSVFIDLDKKN